ncbi:MAG: HEAT repeat domain-containing protein [Spirochaetes bacterium]|nr:HEAT repeat domain-containing protein [Spirochaetota bacterium]
MNRFFLQIFYLLLSVLIFPSAGLGADSVEILENGTPEQKIEMIYNMGYARSKRGFWYFVKYLDYLPNGNESPDSIKMREASAEALGRIEYEPAVKYLIARYEKETQIKVKIKIIFALSFYRDEKSFPVIKNALSSKDPDLRFEALITASKYENPEFKSFLETGYSESKDIPARCASAYGLYMLDKEKQYLDFIISGLKERSPEARYWAAHYLRLIGEVSVMPHIINALKVENKYWVRNELELAAYSLRDKEREIEESERNTRFDFLVN